ncbi:MAG: homocysteine S-methyltransferase family protein [Acidobacteria bacterium]|nr:homocysteine S-methyltransferase family protein [Acidobacteriota bacterium]
MTTNKNGILARIRERGILFDGAMGTLIEARRPELPDFSCGEQLVLEKGPVIADIHRRYFEAGADVVETCTFGATPHKLGLYGLDGKVREINFQAVMLARRAALDFPDALVAGSIGPTGLLSIEKRTDFSHFYRNFHVQAESLLLAGVDILLLETCNDVLEARAGILACRDAMKRVRREAVLAVSFTLDGGGRVLMGTPLEVAALSVDHMGVDLIGVNCSMGPDTLFELAKGLPSKVRALLLAMPNCGLPENRDGKAVYTMPPETFADLTLEFRKAGFHALGGCCGTTPECIRALRERFHRVHFPASDGRRKGVNALTGAFEMIHLDGPARPVLIGERLNYHGSRKFRTAMDNADLDTMIAIANAQLEHGAGVLDVCLATRELPRHLELIRSVYPALTVNVPGPLMADTTEPEALEEACCRMHGRGILNSCNLEDEDKCRKVMQLARRYGQMLVCLPLTPEGIPREAARRLEVAQKLLAIALEEGLAPSDLLFDPLVLTLGTGRPEDRTNGIVALDALELFKRNFPASRTVMGVSNVSYGLPPAARIALNNALLHHAARLGLDFAIFNPLERRKREEVPAEMWQAAEDLIFDRSTEALDTLLGLRPVEEAAAPGLPAAEAADPATRLREMILRRRREGFLPLMERTAADASPQAVVSEVFLKAMQEVGRLMDEKGLPLPYVLESASMVQEGLTHLKRLFPVTETKGKGRIVLATVKGDVHDIGKNLVRMLLTHNGFDVVDLGVDVASEHVVDAAVTGKADAVGLSALLVSTSREMRRVVELLHARGGDVPVVLGGAAVNAAYAREVGCLEDGPYEGGVFHAPDAFHGLKLFDGLVEAGQRDRLKARALEESRAAGLLVEARMRGVPVEKLVEERPARPRRPFLEKAVRTFCVDIGLLIRGFDFEHQCGKKFLGKGRMEEEFYESLLRTGQYLLDSIRKENLTAPMGVVGTFPVQFRDDRLVLRKDDADFPVSLSPSCWKRLIRRDEELVLPILAVTLGGRLNTEVKRRFDEGDYLKGYMLSTIGAELAEEMAEVTTCAMLEEMGVERHTVVRYSPGYPIWPELEDQRALFEILGVEDRIGARLSEGFQIIPEFSVTAGLVHKVT